MASSTPTIDPATAAEEPATRTVTRDLPNLRNPAFAADYLQQRSIINDAAPAQRIEMDFWEAAQSSEGWF